MLERVSFGSKLKLYFILPFALALLVTAYLIHEEFREFRSADQVHAEIQLSLGLANVVHKLQIERGLSAGYLSSGSTRLRDEVAVARTNVDNNLARLTSLKTSYRDLLPDAISEQEFQWHYQQAQQALQRLSAMRVAIDKRDAEQAFTTYSSIIAQQLHLISSIQMGIPFVELHQLDHEFINLLWLQERMGQERGAMNGLLSSGVYDNQLGMAIWDWKQEQSALLAQLQHTAREATRNHLAELQNTPVEASVADVRALLSSTMLQQERLHALATEIDLPSLIVQYQSHLSTKPVSEQQELARKLEQALALTRLTQTELAHDLSVPHRAALKQISDALGQMLTNVDRAPKPTDNDTALSLPKLTVLASAINQLQTHQINYDHHHWWKIATERLNQYHDLSNAIAIELDGTAMQRRGLVGWRITVIVLMAMLSIFMGSFFSHRFRLQLLAKLQGVSVTLSSLAATSERKNKTGDKADTPVSDELSVIHDSLNELIIANKTHRQATAISNTVFEHLSEGVVICDGNNKIQSVNPAFTAISGYTPSEVIGQGPHRLKSGLQDRAFYQAMWKSLDRYNRWSGEIQNRHKNGEIYPQHLSISVLRNAEGQPLQYIGLFTDLSEVKQYEQKIWRQANYDPVTGLPNRNMLVQRIEEEKLRASQNGLKFGLFFIDLDRFKYINDSFGHSAGDELLKVVAQRLTSSVQQGDLVARIGGDEFVIVITNLKDNHCNEAIAQRLLSALHPPIALDENYQTVISCSIGITMFPEDGGSSEELLKNADTAMYKAKELGRNRYAFFTSDMQALVIQQTYREQDLRKALQTNSFELHYQPIFCLQQGNIIGAEALIRMKHTERGLIYPDEFIELAEELMLINPIFDWVLNQALSSVASWHKEGLPLHVAVNVSPKQSGLANKVINALSLHGVQAKYLKLEITEGLSIENNAELIKDLSLLRQQGIAIHLDDFGTGYSSLNYLTRLPIDLLKIDRSFLPLDDSEERFRLVNAVIRIAKSLNLEVLAEGIEHQSQYHRLKGLGCNFGQGYLVSKPLPEKAFQQLLRRQNGYVKLTPPAQFLQSVG